MGAPIGTGEQFMPWIHEDDLTEMYYQAIVSEKMSGIYNAVSSEHITNSNFTKSLANILSKKLWMPKIPAFMLKMVLGEMSEILLKGSKVDNTKIMETGIKLKFPNLNEALKDIYS